MDVYDAALAAYYKVAEEDTIKTPKTDMDCVRAVVDAVLACHLPLFDIEKEPS